MIYPVVRVLLLSWKCFKIVLLWLLSHLHKVFAHLIHFGLWWCNMNLHPALLFWFDVLVVWPKQRSKLAMFSIPSGFWRVADCSVLDCLILAWHLVDISQMSGNDGLRQSDTVAGSNIVKMAFVNVFEIASWDHDSIVMKKFTHLIRIYVFGVCNVPFSLSLGLYCIAQCFGFCWNRSGFSVEWCAGGQWHFLFRWMKFTGSEPLNGGSV